MTERMEQSRPRRVWTAAVLVMVNLVPLAMVVAGEWDLRQVLVLFWVENGVVGVYGVLRILLAARVGWFGRLFASAFLTMHYGGFFIGHGLFLLFLLGMAVKLGDPGSLREAASLVSWPVVLCYFGSHGFSFLRNYVFGGERHEARLGGLMARPYARVLVLHLVLVAGGAAILHTGEPRWMLALLVAVKCVLDLYLHLRDHRQGQAA